MALDKVPAALMSGLLVSETAPSNPGVGQRWYKASTAVTYQYTNDGTSSFWLDVTSAGIGTSAERGVDFVGDTDPHKATNLGAVGSVYYNREKNRHFVCTTATSGSQVWSGIYDGAGGVVNDYVVSSTAYRSHTFLGSGTFLVQGSATFDYLIIGGGGSGGQNGGGGGAGGFYTATNVTLTAGRYAVVIGLGGKGEAYSGGNGNNGTDSSFNSITMKGGGAGGNWGEVGHANGNASGGGGGGASSAGGAGGSNGNNGGAASGSTVIYGGGGGAGEAGNTDGAGYGGDGAVNAYRTGSNITYAGGGGGGIQGSSGQHGLGGDGGGGDGTTAASFDSGTGGSGTANTGSGGGGSGGGSATSGSGGSGIVVIRYAL